jgi:nicotinamide-nucleotide amidase
MNYEITVPANALIKLCIEKKLTIATAESCTGGLVAAALTDVPGSSAVFDRGFVTYSNAAKQQMLGVPAATLKQYGAVSRQTAEAMAAGALARSKVDLAVSITGIAGPDGGTPDKPVGLVHFAVAARDGSSMHAAIRCGDIGRAEVRHQSVVHALRMLRKLAEGEDEDKPRKILRDKPKKPVIVERVIKPWPDRERG